MEHQIGALLLALERFKDGETTIEEVESIAQYLAFKAKVETFGDIGEAVPFKPFEHFPVGAVTEVGDVVIQMRGARFIRDDGSHRVLIKALVN
jgi:hypothetical protein